MTAPLPRAPRPIFCALENAYRDRGVADAVCAGRFTNTGLTLELGPDPDWLTDALPEDKEWRIEWSKFYYGLDLAAAFGETGDVRYLETWCRLVRSWIARVPVGHDRSDVTGRRLQNWIYAWARFAAAPAFDGLVGDLEEPLTAHLAAEAAYLRDHLTPERNHRTLELYALFVLALSLPELDSGGDLLEFAIAELYRNLLLDVRPDGVHREASTHYHCIALRSYVGVRENARRFRLVLPPGYDDRLARACEFLLHCQRPDGGIPAFSDSDSGDYHDLLALAGRLLDRPDFLYAATAGAEGIPPAERCAGFQNGGYYFQRSGWGERAPFREERYLAFDCGPLGDGGHGHYDLLSVEIAAGGRPLIVDPGRYTYSDAGADWRRWFKGTAAHNTVCVDRVDQTSYRRSKPKGQTATGRLLSRIGAPGLDVLHGQARSPAYEAVHTRQVVFVANEYWLVIDRLRGNRPHHYDLRWHLTPAAEGRTVVEDAPAGSTVRAPGLVLVFPGTHAVTLEDGWVAPLYGVKEKAPVVSVVTDGSTDADFLTLVYPVTGERQPPTAHLVADGALARRATNIWVVGAGADGEATDWLSLDVPASAEPEPRLGKCTRAVWLRTSAVAGLIHADVAGENR